MTRSRKRKFLFSLVNATSSHGYCSCSTLSLESDLVFTEPFSGSEKTPTVEYPVRQQTPTVTEDTPLSEKQPCLDEKKNASGTDEEDEPSFRRSDSKKKRSSSGYTPESGTDPHFGHKLCFFFVIPYYQRKPQTLYTKCYT